MLKKFGLALGVGAVLAAAGAEDPEAGAEDGCELPLAKSSPDGALAAAWASEGAGASAAGAADDEEAAGAAAGAGAAGSSGAAAPQAMSRPAIRMNNPVKLSLGQPMVIGVPPSVTVWGSMGLQGRRQTRPKPACPASF